MTIFQGELKQFGAPARSPRPAPEGFFEEVATAHEAARRTQNTNAFGLLEQEEYSAQIDAIEEETGERLPSPFSLRGFEEVSASFDEQEMKMRLGGAHITDVRDIRTQKNKEAFDERISALREKFPDAKNLFDRKGLEERMSKRAQQLEGRANELGFLPNLAGGFSAAVTDPLTLMTLPVGSTSKTVLGAVIRNAALNAGIETVLQPGVQDARERLGLPSGLKEGAINVLFAGAAGGFLGGGGKALSDLLGFAAKSPDPEIRAGAAEVTRDLEIVADAAEAANAPRDIPIAPEKVAALNEKLNAAGRILDDEVANPDDVKIVLGERDPIKFTAIRTDEAITPTGRSVRVEYGLVELSDLVASHDRNFMRNPAYPADLQPRDRNRAASTAQVTKLAADLNPRLLDDAADAGGGAPIIAPDGVVESGNGRVMAIDKVYRDNADKAKAYKDYLISRDYPVDDFAEPVLVRKRVDDLEPADREAFTREANSRSTAAMSATEQARSDAKALNARDFDILDGDNPAAAKNASFIRQVVNRIAPEAERGALMDKHGRLSDEGTRRVRNAIFAYAYDDEILVNRLLDGGDDLKSLGQAMIDAAPEWGRLRAGLEAGDIDPRADMRPFIAEAANIVAEARATGRDVAEFVGQVDIFSGALDARSASFLRLFFRNEDFTQVRARAKIAEELNFYAKEARKAQNGASLFGDAEDPGARILNAVRGRADGDQASGQSGLFDPRQDAGPASLLPDTGGGGRGAQTPGRGIDEFADPSSPATKQAVAAQVERATDDLEGLADDADIVTGIDADQETGAAIARTQTKAELKAEFDADDAAIARLKGCIK